MPPAATATAPAPPSAAAAFQSLNDFNSTRETPQAATDAANSKYGVTGLASQLDQLRGLTSNLQTAIGNVAPSVAGRTSGSLVTQAQRDAITNNETQPLTDQFNKVSTNLNDVNGQYNEAQGLASNYANSLLTSDQQKYQDLFGQYTNAQSQEAATAAQALEQQKLAEQVREANLSASTARAGQSAGPSPTLGSGGSTGVGGMTRDANGGYAFTGAGNVPLTMGQYLAANGYQTAAAIKQGAVTLLNQSGSAHDKAIATDIGTHNYTPAQLAQNYPQVFGGSY